MSSTERSQTTGATITSNKDPAPASAPDSSATNASVSPVRSHQSSLVHAEVSQSAITGNSTGSGPASATTSSSIESSNTNSTGDAAGNNSSADANASPSMSIDESPPLVSWPGMPSSEIWPGSFPSLPLSLANITPSFGPLNAEWPFNSTVAITLNASSPMLDLDAGMAPFKIDEATGYRTYKNEALLIGASVSMSFVGVGFSMNGTAVVRPGSDPNFWPPNRTDPAVIELFSIPFEGQQLRLTKDGSQLVNAGSKDLGDLSNLNLSSYILNLNFNNETDLTFHNATVQIPLRTQALVPSFTALLSQAQTLRVVHGTNEISPYMRTSLCSEADELGMQYELLSKQHVGSAFTAGPGFPNFHFNNGHLVLENSTELIYTVPSNTTLIEVLGPVGDYSDWSGLSRCYAVLNPRPRWWQKPNFPLSVSQKFVNASDQTMFLLPIDPAIEYEVRVGSYGNETSCPVSAIRTYPFHYNFSADIVNSASPANPGNETTPLNSADTGASTSKRTDTTSIIVGVVVGVGGGLILLGLIIWFLRRRRRQREENEQRRLMPDPYFSEAATHPRTKAELERMARGDGLPDSAQHDAPISDPQTLHDVAAAEPRRPPGPRIVQEEDAESYVEYLPPRYRPWLVGGQGDADILAPVDSVEGPSPSPEREAPSSGKAISAAEEDSARQHESVDDAPLKQEYARAFGQAHLQHAAGRGAASDLRNEYKRLFDLSTSEKPDGITGSSKTADARADQGGSSEQHEDLKDEYKRWLNQARKP